MICNLILLAVGFYLGGGFVALLLFCAAAKRFVKQTGEHPLTIMPQVIADSIAWPYSLLILLWKDQA